MFLSLSPGRTLCCRSRSQALSDGFCLREPGRGTLWTLDMMRGWSTPHSVKTSSLFVLNQQLFMLKCIASRIPEKYIFVCCVLYIGFFIME